MKSSNTFDKNLLSNIELNSVKGGNSSNLSDEIIYSEVIEIKLEYGSKVEEKDGEK